MHKETYLYLKELKAGSAKAESEEVLCHIILCLEPEFDEVKNNLFSASCKVLTFICQSRDLVTYYCLKFLLKMPVGD
jgi:hypothetical protein